MYSLLIARLVVIYRSKKGYDQRLEELELQGFLSRACYIVVFIELGYLLNIVILVVYPLVCLFPVIGICFMSIVNPFYLWLGYVIFLLFRPSLLKRKYKKRINDLILENKKKRIFHDIELWMIIAYSVFVYVFPFLVLKAVRTIGILNIF